MRTPLTLHNLHIQQSVESINTRRNSMRELNMDINNDEHEPDRADSTTFKRNAMFIGIDEKDAGNFSTAHMLSPRLQRTVTLSSRTRHADV